MSADFLLEIGTEEIPAWMIPSALVNLQELLEKELRARGLLADKPVETLATPRRLVACCVRLAAAEPDRVNEVVGPPKSVAYGPDGKPTRAATSFAEKQGIPVGQLKAVETLKGSYVAAVTRHKGKPARAVLAEILPGVITRISFPRSMYWTSARGLRFIRPIRWLVALYAGHVIEFELEGVRSGRATRGHRILANKAIPVRSLDDYRRKLRQAFVVVDPAERRARIAQECGQLLKPLKLRPRRDEALLDLLVHSVEHPAVVRGEFAPEFMALPAEVLITVMRHHQKYLSVENRQGQLAPLFLAVIDLDGDPGGDIRQGHEAVLAARFGDAQFFWQADQKRPLAERLPLLETMTFQERLGNYRQKVERVVTLGEWLGGNVLSAEGRRADIPTVKRAALLSKADLTTEMVGELPELQGIIGGLYARGQGEVEAVARAIYEHHRPLGPDDAVPRSFEGALLAVADKLDTIAACFSVGLAPTGSRDPFALRRAGTGIVRIILERGLRLSLRAAVAAAGGGQTDAAVVDFLEERARHLFRDVRQFAYDEVNAAFAARLPDGQAGWDDLVDTAARLEALRRLRPTPDFEPIAAAFKRIRNILEQAGDGSSRAARPVDTNYVEAGPERELYDRFQTLRGRVAALREKHNYEEALRLIASLRPQVDRFFDKVLVMAPDQAVRENRLALLAHLLQEFSTVADFSEIVTGPRAKES